MPFDDRQLGLKPGDQAIARQQGYVPVSTRLSQRGSQLGRDPEPFVREGGNSPLQDHPFGRHLGDAGLVLKIGAALLQLCQTLGLIL